MIIMGCFTALLFSGLTSITSNSQGLGKVSDTSGNTMIIPQAAAQGSEVSEELAEIVEEQQQLVEEGTCTVRIMLNSIEYSRMGNDIGNDWRFSYRTPAEGAVNTREFKLNRGEFYTVNLPAVINTVALSGGRAGFDFEYGAREVDTFRDDVGRAEFHEALDCFTNPVIADATLRVDERGGGGIANIVFHFVIRIIDR
jgi:hypothetical protein